ncbi:hypothetical protein [Bradyrhizobium cenepequi]
MTTTRDRGKLSDLPVGEEGRATTESIFTMRLAFDDVDYRFARTSNAVYARRQRFRIASEAVVRRFFRLARKFSFRTKLTNGDAELISFSSTGRPTTRTYPAGGSQMKFAAIALTTLAMLSMTLVPADAAYKRHHRAHHAKNLGNPNGTPGGPTSLSGTGSSQYGGSSPGTAGKN